MNWGEDLIEYRREKAINTLEDADLLFRNNRFFSAVNRIYYSMFYEVIALLFKERIINNAQTLHTKKFRRLE